MLVAQVMAHSLCFGGFVSDAQVAFGRVVTDRSTFAHLKDVVVLQPFRGKGYGVALIQAIVSHPDLRAVAMTLATNDAHELYGRFGFGPHSHPDLASQPLTGLGPGGSLTNRPNEAKRGHSSVK